MAAGVHDRHGLAQTRTGGFAGVRQAGHLLDRQRVHVRAQGHDRAGQCALEHGHHPRFTHLGAHLQTQALELFSDQCSGLELLIAHLRVLVNGMTQRNNL